MLLYFVDDLGEDAEDERDGRAGGAGKGTCLSTTSLYVYSCIAQRTLVLTLTAVLTVMTDGLPSLVTVHVYRLHCCMCLPVLHSGRWC